MLATLLALLLAEDRTCEIRLRFEKGMVYEDASRRHVTLTLVEQGRIFRYDTEEECVLRRTVLDVGEDGLPSSERVEVVKLVVRTRQHPKPEEEGDRPSDAQGRTFVWRRTKEAGFALYDGAEDVTEKRRRVVERLAGCAGLLPGAAVAVGATWEVHARAFLVATGQQVPADLEGKAVFKLEDARDALARISFEVKTSSRERGHELTGVQRGTWVVDLARGREQSLELDASIEIDRMDKGAGTFKMRRAITHR